MPGSRTPRAHQSRPTPAPALPPGYCVYYYFVWCQPNGRPIGAHADWDEWKALLKTTGIREVRVHDARHTAATLLLAQGVDQRVVMEILGHSQISMTSRYAHVLPQVMTDAAERIGRALWGEP
jgi:site-specific recombinase XerD